MGPFIALAVILAAVFGVCFLVDKLFTKLFRSKAQHATGLSVRLNKKFGSIGLIVAMLGLAGVVVGVPGNWLLMAGGLVLFLVGTGLSVYYVSFGIYYDDESFLFSSFGKKSKTYRYGDIQAQQLYVTTTGVLLELHMTDGKAVQLQPGMIGTDAFIKKAFEGWLQQTGRELEDCDFHDPSQSCWFPPAEK